MGAEAGIDDAGAGNPSGTGGSDRSMANLGASRFLKVCFGKKIGPVPNLDIDLEIAAQNAVRDLIRLGLVRSAHDCSEGGLAVALAECCFNPDGLLGADVDLENCGGSRAGCAGGTPASAAEDREGDDAGIEATSHCAALFNEAQSRIIISCDRRNVDTISSQLKSKNLPHAQIGAVIRNDLRISLTGENFTWRVADLHDLWWNAIRRAVESDSEPIPSL